MLVGAKISSLRSGDDAGFLTALAVHRADAAVRNPGDPEITAEILASDLFTAMPDYRRVVTVAEVDGEPAGLLTAVYRTEPDGDNWLAEVDVMVLPDHRRRGIARDLVDDVLPQLGDVGLKSVLAFPALDMDADAAVALCERYGLTKRAEERCSRALVADVDASLLEGWIEDAATSASGYQLETWKGRTPDHLLEAFCTASAAMEDAPIDDMDYDEHTRGPEAQRDADEVCERRRLQVYRALALSESGEAAGMSELFVHRDVPEVGYQGNTGVVAAHRGHRLGRWLKAVNHRQVVASHPEMRVIETYNAQSNPWMLDINVAMGFRPHHIYGVYQAPIETALAAVGASPPRSERIPYERSLG
jgi:GNAT superfamily N-acetyltransferase